MFLFIYLNIQPEYIYIYIYTFFFEIRRIIHAYKNELCKYIYTLCEINCVMKIFSRTVYSDSFY